MIPKFDLNFPLETQGKLSNYNVFTLVAPKGNDAYMSLSITNALKGLKRGYSVKRYSRTLDGRTSVTVSPR
jgi:hypothetical protein